MSLGLGIYGFGLVRSRPWQLGLKYVTAEDVDFILLSWPLATFVAEKSRWYVQSVLLSAIVLRFCSVLCTMSSENNKLSRRILYFSRLNLGLMKFY